MHLSLEEFCAVLKNAKRSNAEKALAVLWHADAEQLGAIRSAGQLAKVLDDHHVGTPNQTALAEGIRRTKLATESKAGFSLKPGSRKLIQGWLPDLDGIQPAVDQSRAFLPEEIWRNTRGYIESVCREVNGTFQSAYYNASGVMIRRLLETLVIETYEHLGREVEIKDGGGNYFMLSDLAERACGEGGHRGLNLGRDSKKAMKEARNVGNWSAHARRFIANANDLKKLQAGVRLLVEELIQIADLVKRKSERIV